MQQLSADEVRAIRAGLGLSQAQLAAKLGGAPDLVRDWERGRCPCRGPAALALRLLAALSSSEEAGYILAGVFGE